MELFFFESNFFLENIYNYFSIQNHPFTFAGVLGKNFWILELGWYTHFKGYYYDWFYPIHRSVARLIWLVARAPVTVFGYNFLDYNENIFDLFVPRCNIFLTLYTPNVFNYFVYDSFYENDIDFLIIVFAFVFEGYLILNEYFFKIFLKLRLFIFNDLKYIEWLLTGDKFFILFFISKILGLNNFFVVVFIKNRFLLLQKNDKMVNGIDYYFWLIDILLILITYLYFIIFIFFKKNFIFSLKKSLKSVMFINKSRKFFKPLIDVLNINTRLEISERVPFLGIFLTYPLFLLNFFKINKLFNFKNNKLLKNFKLFFNMLFTYSRWLPVLRVFNRIYYYDKLVYLPKKFFLLGLNSLVFLKSLDYIFNILNKYLLNKFESIKYITEDYYWNELNLNWGVDTRVYGDSFYNSFLFQFFGFWPSFFFINKKKFINIYLYLNIFFFYIFFFKEILKYKMMFFSFLKKVWFYILYLFYNLGFYFKFGEKLFNFRVYIVDFIIDKVYIPSKSFIIFFWIIFFFGLFGFYIGDVLNLILYFILIFFGDTVGFCVQLVILFFSMLVSICNFCGNFIFSYFVDSIPGSISDFFYYDLYVGYHNRRYNVNIVDPLLNSGDIVDRLIGRLKVLFEFDFLGLYTYKYLGLDLRKFFFEENAGYISPKFFVWYLNHSPFYKGPICNEITDWTIFCLNSKWGLYGFFIKFKPWWNLYFFIVNFIIGCFKSFYFFSYFIFKEFVGILGLFLGYINMSFLKSSLIYNISFLIVWQIFILKIYFIFKWLVIFFLTIIFSYIELFISYLGDNSLNFIGIFKTIFFYKFFISIYFIVYDFFLFIQEGILHVLGNVVWKTNLYNFNARFMLEPNFKNYYEYKQLWDLETILNLFFYEVNYINKIPGIYLFSKYPIINFSWFLITFYLFIYLFFKLLFSTLSSKFRDFVYDISFNPINPFIAWDKYVNSVYFDLSFGDFKLMLNSGVAYDNTRYSWDKKVDSFFIIPLSPQPGLSKILRKIWKENQWFTGTRKHWMVDKWFWQSFVQPSILGLKRLYIETFDIFGVDVHFSEDIKYFDKAWLIPKSKISSLGNYWKFFYPITELTVKEQFLYYREFSYILPLVLTHFNPAVLGKFYKDILTLYPKLNDVLSKNLIKKVEPLELVGISSKDFYEKLIEFDYNEYKRSPLAELAFAVDTSMYAIAPNSSILNNEKWAGSSKLFYNWLLYLDRTVFYNRFFFRDSFLFFGQELYPIKSSAIQNLKEELKIYRVEWNVAESSSYVGMDGFEDGFSSYVPYDIRLSEFVDKSFIKDEKGKDYLSLTLHKDYNTFSQFYVYNYGLIFIVLFFFFDTYVGDRFPVLDLKFTYDWMSLNLSMHKLVYFYYLFLNYMSKLDIELFYLFTNSSTIGSINDYDLFAEYFPPIKTNIISNFWKTPKNILYHLLFESNISYKGRFHLLNYKEWLDSFLINYFVWGPLSGVDNFIWSFYEVIKQFIILFSGFFSFYFIYCFLGKKLTK